MLLQINTFQKHSVIYILCSQTHYVRGSNYSINRVFINIYDEIVILVKFG